MLPEKREQAEAVRIVVDEYRRIELNAQQILALIGNIERSLSAINETQDLNLIFTQVELEFLADINQKIINWNELTSVQSDPENETETENGGE